MIEDVYRKIWELSPDVQNPESYSKLVKSTKELIGLYDIQGRLSEDPFSPTRLRKLSLPVDKISNLFKDSTVVVTGGLGCVGSILGNDVLKFGIKRLVILDSRNPASEFTQPNVTFVRCDVRDFSAVSEIFAQYRPDFVFHAGAQRDPGYAESHIVETVTTNVIGTLNIVRACEQSGTVKQCIFSSTGKASRYLTEEVYSATKKLCEYILDSYARRSKVRYCMVRFTHILDNSIMNQQLQGDAERNDYIAVHCPGKFVTAQNAQEAAYLLLNGLIYSEDSQCNFLIVRNLEWPVESLEMALYYIKVSGREIPVIFMGNPIGYTEKFFRGQMDWSNPQDLNLLINVYEQKYRRHNPEDDIIISHICRINDHVLEKVLHDLETVAGEQETKDCLLKGLKEIVRESLTHVDKRDTVNILNWGLNKKVLEIEKTKISDYGPIIPLMFESLEGSEHYKQVESLLSESHSH